MNVEGSPAHVSEDDCFALILDVLPERETEAALGHMASCAACERRFQRMAAEWERLAARAQLDPRLRRDLASREEAAVPGRGRTRFSSAWNRVLSRPRWRIGVAVAFAAILVAILVPTRMRDPHRHLLTKLPPFAGDVETRQAMPAAPRDALLESLDAYADDDFARAASGLRALDLSGPLDVFRNVYLGSALAWAGRYGEAVRVLEAVPLDLAPDPWSGEARWTLYVALRGSGRTARADSLLAELAGLPGEVGARARELKPRQR